MDGNERSNIWGTREYIKIGDFLDKLVGIVAEPVDRDVNTLFSLKFERA